MTDVVLLDHVAELAPAEGREGSEGIFCQHYATCLFHITIGPW